MLPLVQSILNEPNIPFTKILLLCLHIRSQVHSESLSVIMGASSFNFPQLIQITKESGQFSEGCIILILNFDLSVFSTVRSPDYVVTLWKYNTVKTK